MTLEDRLERLANRTPPGDPADVMAAARSRAESRPESRSPRLLAAAAAAAVLAVVALAAGGIALTGGDSPEAVTTAGPGTDNATVAVSAIGLPSVDASTSPLTPSARAWLQHTVTLRNTGTERVTLTGFVGGESLGDDELAVATEGCTFSGSPNIACLGSIPPPVEIEPGGTHDFTVTLWRDLPAMNPVTDATYSWNVPVRRDDRPTDPQSSSPASLLTITYENLVNSDAPVDEVDGAMDVAVPESGASAQQLADGTPVWVVRHDDGTVSVVDAVSTHRPFGAGTLVAWCGASREFVDPMYGSMFDERGRKRAGPAPSGLAEHPVASGDGDTVTVTGPPSDQPRVEEGGPTPSEPAGPGCFGSIDPDTSFIEGSYEMHPLASAAPVPAETAVSQPDGTLVVLDAPVSIVDGQQPTVCTSPLGGSPRACDGIAAPGLFPQDEDNIVLRGPFIARVNDGALVDIAYLGERTVQGDLRAVVEGDTAVWDLDPASLPTESSTAVTALVTRLGCNGGRTGKVLEPVVSADGEQVVVTFSVEPVPGGDCPGNDSVPYVVELGGPLGDRELVDGACLSGDAASTSHCSDGAVRWPAPA